MLGLLLTVILSYQEIVHASQTPRELEQRLIQIQETLRQESSSRQDAVRTVVERIDSSEKGLGPKLDKLGTQMEVLNGNFATALDMMKSQSGSAVEVRAVVKDVLDMISDFVISILPLVGVGVLVKRRRRVDRTAEEIRKVGDDVRRRT